MPWNRAEGDEMSVTVEDLLKLPSLLGAGVAAGKSGPILTVACGPTNSVRGAGYLSKSQKCGIPHDMVPREEALGGARKEAIAMAVEEGAIEETAEIIDMEDVPLACYPGNT